MHKKVHSTFSTVLYNKTIVTVKILNSYSHIKLAASGKRCHMVCKKKKGWKRK